MVRKIAVLETGLRLIGPDAWALEATDLVGRFYRYPHPVRGYETAVAAAAEVKGAGAVNADLWELTL